MHKLELVRKSFFGTLGFLNLASLIGLASLITAPPETKMLVWIIFSWVWVLQLTNVCMRFFYNTDGTNKNV